MPSILRPRAHSRRVVKFSGPWTEERPGETFSSSSNAASQPPNSASEVFLDRRDFDSTPKLDDADCDLESDDETVASIPSTTASQSSTTSFSITSTSSASSTPVTPANSLLALPSSSATSQSLSLSTTTSSSVTSASSSSLASLGNQFRTVTSSGAGISSTSMTPSPSSSVGSTTPQVQVPQSSSSGIASSASSSTSHASSATSSSIAAKSSSSSLASETPSPINDGGSSNPDASSASPSSSATPTTPTSLTSSIIASSTTSSTRSSSSSVSTLTPISTASDFAITVPAATALTLSDLFPSGQSTVSPVSPSSSPGIGSPNANAGNAWMSDSAASTSRPQTGTILAGVFGALGGVVLVAGLLFLFARRRHRAPNQGWETVQRRRHAPSLPIQMPVDTMRSARISPSPASGLGPTAPSPYSFAASDNQRSNSSYSNQTSEHLQAPYITNAYARSETPNSGQSLLAANHMTQAGHSGISPRLLLASAGSSSPVAVGGSGSKSRFKFGSWSSNGTEDPFADPYASMRAAARSGAFQQAIRESDPFSDHSVGAAF